MPKAKIAIISSGQPSLNPRLVKEADALADAGYEVVVIYLYWNHWGTRLDEQLFALKKWQPIRVAGSPGSDQFSYRISQLVQKAAQKAFAFTGRLTEYAVSRGTLALYRKAIEQKADLYIGHNMGALAPAVWAAKHTKKRCGFDAEDFHRNETSNDPQSTDVKLKKRLEEKYFPQLDYMIAASPLIAAEYARLFPGIRVSGILNVFPKTMAAAPSEKEPAGPLKLFWFSQTIGQNRGLEEVFEALGAVPEIPTELHLLGELREQDKAYFNDIIQQHNIDTQNIFFYPPIAPGDILSFASQFDIGLATETGIPFNRNICLTNKIFTYIQSGLAIIGSDTKAQVDLLKSYPGMGFTYPKKSADGLRAAIQKYHNDRMLLGSHKAQAFAYGQSVLNWETEQNKLISIISGILHSA